MGARRARISAATSCRSAARSCRGVRAHCLCAARAAANASSTSPGVHAWNAYAGALASAGATEPHVRPELLSRQAPSTRNLYVPSAERMSA